MNATRDIALIVLSVAVIWLLSNIVGFALFEVLRGTPWALTNESGHSAGYALVAAAILLVMIFRLKRRARPPT